MQQCHKQNFNQVGELKITQRFRSTVESGGLSTETDSSGPITSLNPFHHFAIPSCERLRAPRFLPYVRDANPTLKNLIQFALVQQLGMPGLLGF